MSTDLCGVRVIAIDPEHRRLRLRVFVVYYDTQGKNPTHEPLPHDASFFLGALWKAADTRFGEGGPLGDAISVDQICSEDWVNSNTFRFVERFEQLAKRNHPVANWKALHDFYYARDGVWQDEDRLVQADYDVYFTDARYLEGIPLGASYGTTAYNQSADALRVEDAARVPDLRLVARRLNPFPGGMEYGRTQHVAVSGDGRYLACVNEASDVVVYETKGFTEVMRKQAPRDELFASARFLPSGDALLLQWPDRPGLGAFEWKLPSGEVAEVSHEPAHVWSARGNVGIAFGEDYGATARLLSGDSVALETGPRAVEGGAVSLDESRVVIGGMRRELLVFALPSGERVGEFVIASERVGSVAVDPRGEYALATVDHRKAVVVRLADGAILRKLDGGGHYVKNATWSPDGRWAALVLSGQGKTAESEVVVYEVGAEWPEAKHRAKWPAPEDELAESIDRAMIERFARDATPRSADELAAVLRDHAEFLASGGAGGEWETVNAAGFVLAVYGGTAERGKQAVLRMANLSGLAMAGVDLSYADLTGVWCERGDFAGAKLAGASATDAHLPGAVFDRADLAGADFSRANLAGASFRGANLERADFEKADVTGADFTHARIGGIKLRGAKVHGVIGFGELPLASKGAAGGGAGEARAKGAKGAKRAGGAKKSAKRAVKKGVVKKRAVKKAAVKKGAKKPAKKPAKRGAVKTAAKKTTAKKTTDKKSAKKTTVKKSAKKTAAKKGAARTRR